MLNPPTSPLSSATTASTASVYRVTDGGGVVHGAIVRGGGEGGRKRPPAQRQARMAGRGGGKGTGGRLEAGASPFREVPHAGEAPAATTTTGRQQGGGDGGGGEVLFASPVDGQGALLCSPPPSQQQRSPRQHQTHERTPQELAASPPALHHRPETTGHRRLSPRLGQVSVSWGQELRGEEAEAEEEEERVEPFTAVGVPVVSIPSYTRGGRRPRTLQSDRDVWNAEYQDVAADYEKLGSRRSAGGGGFVYEPLSEGPDYRKVRRHFTVQ